MYAIQDNLHAKLHNLPLTGFKVKWKTFIISSFLEDKSGLIISVIVV